ncbi:short-chain fatty acid transporter [Salinarimonas ramus]|uniref:Short-chain fatty acids transporter n=1 Tax=Salinarimonas ramus TaxID=690164 RepID=A0A917Q8D2_9HYPH|nr:short-chain fatty acid transporter [Salinarimonas ramus]GGK35139.1 short-chain fatty acids transporter [Salinarimonas ramus]
MLRRMGLGSARIVERWLPDPFVLVLILTLFVFALGMAVEGETPVAMLQHWGDGFWNLLAFSMQMVLILVTGWVLASTPFVRRILAALGGLAKTPGQAIVLVTLVSLAAAWINWGFGLVIGAMFGRQLARTVAGVDYRLLIASAYSGFVVWHGGLAGSVPLVIATEGHFMAQSMGVVPTSATIFSAFNLLIVACIFVVLPLVNRLMLPKPEETVTVDPAILEETPPATAAQDARTPATRLEESVLLAQAVGVMGIVFAAYYFLAESGALNLNIVNFVFLFLGLMLHGRPVRFLAALQEAAKGASGIIIQFPFYAGIMGMMIGSGLAASLSQGFVAVANETTLPLFTFLAAGIVNIFVPSGGGQWAVQAPVMIPAALELGADLPRIAMAVAWGDAWTNLIQPFWALPALAIAGLRAKDVMGFCLVALVVTGVVIAIGITVFP